MLKATAFAHAVTLVMAVFYLICALLSSLAPQVLFRILQSWIHTVDLNALKTLSPMPLGLLVYGLVTLSLVTWVTTYVTIELYNRLAKGK